MALCIYRGVNKNLSVIPSTSEWRKLCFVIGESKELPTSISSKMYSNIPSLLESTYHVSLAEEEVHIALDGVLKSEPSFVQSLLEVDSGFLTWQEQKGNTVGTI